MSDTEHRTATRTDDAADAYDDAVRRLPRAEVERFAEASARYRAAVAEHLSPALRDLSSNRPVDPDRLRALAAAVADDPLHPAFDPDTARSAEDVVLERLHLVRRVWEPFSDWWCGYFSDRDGSTVPLVDLWQLYVPFARWIVREKRERRPDGLFVMAFNGSPGAGKTVLTTALSVVVNKLLDPRTEGRAVARSGDDWYLGRAEREPLRLLGYDAGVPGVSNRALPGTHDLAWLRRNLAEMERSGPDTVIRMGNFDKRADDQPTGPDRYFESHGRVGVLLFDLWFAGARTDADPADLPDGLRRRVAEHLRGWAPVFDRFDALWAYDWNPYARLLADREAQERLVEQRRGTRGMSREDIRTFMAYMIERAWDWRTTSPLPAEDRITFRAWRDTNHRVIAVHRGGRAS
ncbi:hypothetical protein ACFFSW_02130 [Saccharothrix longispora]|uniref:Pantothenate kinase-related protein Tda10 n=1 Tax=Saccharothrix longispora TaxID=33920 RepID=A0ABU1PVV9_9PSEU|nr:hypothetical protein [Saccharothrix longispora]MDR6594783.1 pantothenate kinase-related protein Tda10 [Saccharothrix longispora]